jgi:uncharacterized protein (TIGR02246 family)
MSEDERAIRDLIAAWLAASRAGDVATVLGLMTDDIVFLMPGQQPFGKAAFAAAAQGRSNVRLEGGSEIEELEIFGDWAYLRSHIDMTMTPDCGPAMRRSGYTLTILRKGADQRWRIARDANLMTQQ